MQERRAGQNRVVTPSRQEIEATAVASEDDIVGAHPRPVDAGDEQERLVLLTRDGEAGRFVREGEHLQPAVANLAAVQADSTNDAAAPGRAEVTETGDGGVGGGSRKARRDSVAPC